MPKRKGIYLLTIISNDTTEQYQTDNIDTLLSLTRSRIIETPHPMDCIITLNNPNLRTTHR